MADKIKCTQCNKMCKGQQGLDMHLEMVHGESRPVDNSPDWTRKCCNCNETPIVPSTGMCGPCTFGEAETVGGNW